MSKGCSSLWLEKVFFYYDWHVEAVVEIGVVVVFGQYMEVTRSAIMVEGNLDCVCTWCSTSVEMCCTAFCEQQKGGSMNARKRYAL